MSEINTEIERGNLKDLDYFLGEIEYRESVLRQMKYDKERKRGFYSNFLKSLFFFRTTKHRNSTEKTPECSVIRGENCYHIDNDVELQSDIIEAFEKSRRRYVDLYNRNVALLVNNNTLDKTSC